MQKTPPSSTANFKLFLANLPSAAISSASSTHHKPSSASVSSASCILVHNCVVVFVLFFCFVLFCFFNLCSVALTIFNGIFGTSSKTIRATSKVH